MFVGVLMWRLCCRFCFLGVVRLGGLCVDFCGCRGRCLLGIGAVNSVGMGILICKQLVVGACLLFR